MHYEENIVQISKILLDQENHRIPAYLRVSQTACLQHLLKHEDAIGLAEKIIESRMLPPFDKVVLLQDGAEFIVIEGNRRIAALKILHDSSLIESEKERSLLYPVDPLILENTKEIPCCIFFSRQDAYFWIQKVHADSWKKSWTELNRIRFVKNQIRDNASYEGISTLLDTTFKETTDYIKKAKIHDAMKIALLEHPKNSLLEDEKTDFRHLFKLLLECPINDFLGWEFFNRHEGNFNFGNENTLPLLSGLVIHNVIQPRDNDLKDAFVRKISCQKYFEENLRSFAGPTLFSQKPAAVVSKIDAGPKGSEPLDPAKIVTEQKDEITHQNSSAPANLNDVKESNNSSVRHPDEKFYENYYAQGPLKHRDALKELSINTDIDSEKVNKERQNKFSLLKKRFDALSIPGNSIQFTIRLKELREIPKHLPNCFLLLLRSLFEISVRELAINSSFIESPQEKRVGNLIGLIFESDHYKPAHPMIHRWKSGQPSKVFLDEIAHGKKTAGKDDVFRAGEDMLLLIQEIQKETSSRRGL